MINLASILRLTRTLTVIDCETTGEDPDRDRIWQMSIAQHYPDKDPVRFATYINPQVPIPPELIERFRDERGNKILTDEVLVKIAKAPPLSHYGKRLAATALANTDYAGHNVLFDLRVTRAELQRLKIDWDWERTDAKVVCTLRIYQIFHPRDLSAAYREYVDPAGFEGAHDASQDGAATEAVLVGQLERHPDAPRTVSELADFCFPGDPDWVDKKGHFAWRHREATFRFGKHRGATLRSVVGRDNAYLTWILKNRFPDDAKAIVEAALKGVLPERDK